MELRGEGGGRLGRRRLKPRVFKGKYGAKIGTLELQRLRGGGGGIRQTIKPSMGGVGMFSEITQ